ncbi:hypothetical protein FBZ82_107155 [Azospirillum brasilense]|uniref:Uncharacterized protein n=1 Tax=Azospirillum brasilense TaxID=192 RepID=A0A560B3I8_AZOBR|nr:hypothetical protein [Azospirillum brasilense]TWA67181.1 hypothetical protein FBZ82_107155 [Azospirillum brasilense]
MPTKDGDLLQASFFISWAIAGALIGFIVAAWEGGMAGTALGLLLSPNLAGRLVVGKRHRASNDAVALWNRVRASVFLLSGCFFVFSLGVVFFDSLPGNPMRSRCVAYSSICGYGANLWVLQFLGNASSSMIDWFGFSRGRMRSLGIVHGYLSFFVMNFLICFMFFILFIGYFAVFRCQLSWEDMFFGHSFGGWKIILPSAICLVVICVGIYSMLSAYISKTDDELFRSHRKVFSFYGRAGFDFAFHAQIFWITAQVFLISLSQFFVRLVR